MLGKGSPGDEATVLGDELAALPTLPHWGRVAETWVAMLSVLACDGDGDWIAGLGRVNAGRACGVREGRPRFSCCMPSVGAMQYYELCRGVLSTI